MINLDYLNDKTFAKKIFAEKFNFVHEKLGFQVLENAIILPYKATVNGQRSKDGWGFGGIVDCNGTYLRRSFVNSGAGEGYTPPPE